MIKKDKYIYALGFFDGVHLGHQALLKGCLALAEQASCHAGVVTFTTHPDTVVQGQTPCLINTLSDRKYLLGQYGMETVVELPFDKSLMEMPWQKFIQLLQEAYGAAGFVCGDDFRFGYRGEGNAAVLMQFCQAAGMPCCVVPQQKLDGVAVSSTYIRHLLEAGDMAQATRFLGHPHLLSGVVCAGQKLGRTIGIPTANITLAPELVIPKCGVYACKAMIDCQEYLAVTNIGTRPTVNGNCITVEPWILDFSGDLYGKEICLQFFSFLREEKKFASLEELRLEIEKNAVQTRKFFEK